MNPGIQVKAEPVRNTPLLPKPSFSPENPYWQTQRFEFLGLHIRPRYTAHDFLYATVWEINCPYDVVSALYVRMAIIATYKLNFLVLGYKVREQFRNKEKHDEKST